jgi:hypothetical protein
MCRVRVGAHAGCMFTTFELSSALMFDRQQQRLGEARRHRLTRTARRARHTADVADGSDQPAFRLHMLPARAARPDLGEELAAS